MPTRSRASRAFSVRRGTGFPWAVALIVVLVLALFAVPIIIEHALAKDVTFTVQDKATTTNMDCSSSSSHSSCHAKSTYMIYTDHGVYTDKDSFAFLKFDSSDVYGQLQRGHRYTCEVTGVRIPFFSVYNNIISCKAAK